MLDVLLPEAKFIRPDKWHLSSMSPTIVLQNGNLKVVAEARGRPLVVVKGTAQVSFQTGQHVFTYKVYKEDAKASFIECAEVLNSTFAEKHACYEGTELGIQIAEMLGRAGRAKINKG
jgi:gamma-glutamyltranspeptidase